MQGTRGRRDGGARWPRRMGAAGLGGALVVTGLIGNSTASAATKASSGRGYTRFSSCQNLRSYVLPLALEQVGPYGFGGGSVRRADLRGGAPVAVSADAAPATAAAAATESSASRSAGASTAAGTSGTNPQEAGVDEGDIVETDGRIVYAVVDGAVRVVDIGAGTLLTTLPLPADAAGEAQLLLDGRRLAIITSAFTQVGAETVVAVYDVTTPAAPVKLVVQHLEGSAVAVRSVDHRARLVINTPFGQRVQTRLQPVRPITTEADVSGAVAANRRIVRSRMLRGPW